MEKALRLNHAFAYLETLSYNIRVDDYISGSNIISDLDFQELLDHFIETEEYEICQKLINKQNDLSRI